MTTIYTVNNKVLKNSANDKWLTKKEGDPYNPLGLPPNTVRVRTNDGNIPVKGQYETATLVPGTNDVYDVYKSGTNFTGLLSGSSNVVEILGANTTGITGMTQMLYDCNKLTIIPLFDTSNVKYMNQMLAYCNKLTIIPLFDTSNVTNMSQMFINCYKVESGALALYQQASTQTNPPTSHTNTFTNCGRNSTTGAAELAQIPTSWGGTGA